MPRVSRSSIGWLRSNDLLANSAAIVSTKIPREVHRSLQSSDRARTFSSSFMLSF